MVVAAVALLATAPAAAQTPEEPPAEPVHPLGDALAGKHFDDGVKAATNGDWPAAYTSFRAALAVREHPVLYQKLAEVAQRLDKHRDAAEYLTLYLLKAPDTEPAAKVDAAKRALAEVKKRVGTLTVTAPEGTDVLVDRVAVGRAPLAREVFVDPGRHEIEARTGDAVGRQIVTVEAGAAASVTLVLGVVPPPDPKPAATVPIFTPPPKVAPRDPARDLLIAGSSAGAAAALVGGVLLGVAASKSAEEGALRDVLVGLSQGNVCLPPSRDPRCDQVKETGRAVDALTSTGSSLLLGGLAIGAASIVVYLVTRDPKNKPAPAALAPRGQGTTFTVRW